MRDLAAGNAGASEATSEDIYRRIFLAAQDGILLVESKSGAITDGNPSILKMLRLTMAQLRKKKIWGIGVAGGFLSSKAAYTRTKGRYLSGNQHLSIRSALGKDVAIELECVPYHGRRGDALQFTIRDITERRKLEAALQEHEDRYRKIFDDNPMGMALISLDDRVIKINRSFEELTGYNEAQMRSRSLMDITHPNHVTAGKEILRAARKCRKGSIFEEKRFIGKNGNIIWANVYLAAVCDIQAEPLHYQATIEDITERKLAEAELAELNLRNLEKEKAIQKLKDEFVFIAAHELSAPVTAMNWAVELLKESEAGRAQSADTAQSLHVIEESTKRLKDLVSELLEVSRLEYGIFKVVPEVFDLSGLIAGSVAAFAQGGTAPVTFERAAGALPAAYADPILVQEVLANLLTNAIKYSAPGAPVTVRVAESGEQLFVLVQDQGFGLSAEDSDKLFQRFSRVDSEETKRITGTGLGLFIAKLVVERMGGQIWAESAGRGYGSTFTFSLPKAKDGGG